jgi:hypothetical protein
MRRGGYTKDETDTYVFSYDLDGWTSGHSEGEYTVDGLACNTSNPCHNSWSDYEWEVDPSECSMDPCTVLQINQWADELETAAEYFTYDPETGAEYYSILDWEEECTTYRKRLMFHWQNAINGWEEQRESIETYSDEYTSAMLVDKFNEDLGLALAAPTSSWQDNSNAATYSLDHAPLQTAAGQALQYRFRILGNQGSTYRVRWQPITLYADQTKATFGPIQEEIVYGSDQHMDLHDVLWRRRDRTIRSAMLDMHA